MKGIDEHSDALLIEARQGSEAAFDTLMRLHQQTVYRIALSCTRQREDALDITQLVFLKVFQNLDRYRASGTFKSWVARIAYNESVNWLRRHSREALYAEPPERAVSSEEPERLLAGKEVREMLLEGIAELNPRYQITVSLRYFDQMKLREIAEVQNCSVNMVKNTLYRALRQLARQLAVGDRRDRDLLLSAWENPS